MSNESRHPGEGAAADNVRFGDDVTSPTALSSQIPTPDESEARSFFERQSPHIHVWIKQPDGPNFGRYFGSDVDGAVSLASDFNSRGHNIYATANISSPQCGDKPSKSDIVAARVAHVDIDPPKDGSPLDPDTVLEALKRDGATYVVKSGNGFNAYWTLGNATDDVATVEAVNRAIAAKYRADHCHNIDRVLRVPGTVNWPDAKKRAAGRVPVLASIALPDSGVRPTLDQLQAYFCPPPPVAPVQPAQPPSSPSVGDEVVVGILRRDAALAALYDGDTNVYAGDHSAAEMALANAVLPRCGWNVEQAKRILLNAPLCQRAKVFERPDYIDRTLQRAMDGRRYGIASQPALPVWPNPSSIGPDEWQFANATPRVIIEYLVYQDVGTLIAAGGTGKTTFILWLAIHVILGAEFAGRKVVAPGRVVILTAEDSREMLVARLRAISFEMFPQGTMPDDERDAKLAAIRDGMVIIDVSASVQRLTCVERDVVRADYAAVDALVALVGPAQPSLVVIDPAVSFGVGEGRVNDAEQGLIEAARRMRAALNAAVFYVHHTGKANAREASEDQYSGRGGSAFADGSRMVFVLNRLKPDKWQGETGTALEPGESGLKLSVAKLSYARSQAPIYLNRRGYRFEHIEPVGKNENEDDEAVFAFLSNKLAKGETFSGNKLEGAGLELSRSRIRRAVARLVEAGRITKREEVGKGLALIPTLAAPDGEGTPK